MKLAYLYPFWGSEHLSASEFVASVIDKGFDGIEINIPKDAAFEDEFRTVLDATRNANPNFICGVQQVFGIQKESPEDYLDKVLARMEHMLQFEPDFINSHTGKDHFSFEDNCKIIDAIEEFSIRANVPVYHEIHRGRFTFHSQTTLRYVDMFPQLKFVGDFSHWCVVSESLLQDQEEILQKIYPHIQHLHARVATEQASQINNPFAPEWTAHLERFTSIWEAVLAHHKNKSQFTITPEFGPFPYMPQQPFSQQPLANQEELNTKMKDYLNLYLP